MDESGDTSMDIFHVLTMIGGLCLFLFGMNLMGQGLKEDGKPATSESRMWVYASSTHAEQQVRYFEYQPDRSGKRPGALLKDYSGCLVTDGYAGYHKFGVVPLICRDGTYLTTVSEGDILRYIKNQADFDIHRAEDVLVREIEKYRPYQACRHTVSETEIFRLALDQNFVPIVDDRNAFIGIIKRKSILNLLYAQTQFEKTGESGND